MDALTVAKEITVALVSRISGADIKPEAMGEWAGEIFKVVLKLVKQGIDEANK